MKAASLFTVALVALGLAGCGPSYDRLDITSKVLSPLGGEIDVQHIQVPEGMIVKAHIVPYNSDDDAMGVQLHSVDPSIMDVINVAHDHDFAFLGNRPGQTQIEVTAEGETVLIVDALVTPQPAPQQ